MKRKQKQPDLLSKDFYWAPGNLTDAIREVPKYELDHESIIEDGYTALSIEDLCKKIDTTLREEGEIGADGRIFKVSIQEIGKVKLPTVTAISFEPFSSKNKGVL